MDAFINLIKSIPGYFIGITPFDITFLVLSFLLLFALFAFLIRNNSLILVPIFIVSTIVIGLFLYFYKIKEGFEGSFKIYYIIIIFIEVFVLLFIYNVELKRDIWAINKTKNKEVEKTSNKEESNITMTHINEIVKAVLNMSKTNTGSIILLSNTKIPSSIIESGVVLNADITSQLIESVFFPNSPLHDGALIIQGSRIYSAGCFLPLSQNVNIPKDLGTRHRAGIGVTETINVISIIVSEESGVISIAKAGKIERFADSKILKKVLKDFYYVDTLKR